MPEEDTEAYKRRMEIANKYEKKILELLKNSESALTPKEIADELLPANTSSDCSRKSFLILVNALGAFHSDIIITHKKGEVCYCSTESSFASKLNSEKKGILKNIVDKLAISIYGKTKEEEDMLFRSFDGKPCGGRRGLRKISWLPRFF
ncbi:MAG: hypothetical protein KAQ64_03040 [Candidatus Pacebacteria bacterium]|nr:hypothetical protein [Candidatus Paceibacterota bacterium]